MDVPSAEEEFTNVAFEILGKDTIIMILEIMESR
jgi:hypothetical protein